MPANDVIFDPQNPSFAKISLTYAQACDDVNAALAQRGDVCIGAILAVSQGDVAWPQPIPEPTPERQLVVTL